MLRLENAFPRLPRGALGERPVFMSPVPGSDRVAVVEQSGVIVSLPLAPGATRADVFLDIRGKVSRQGNEEGLLGLAFHPDFGSGAPYVFLYYSAASPRRSVISRFTVSQGAADPATEQVILEVGQPFSNHNGGMIAFGPDGYLYIGLGDGGSGGDPEGHGQNLGTLLGSILRIDVNRQDAGLRYAIPPDNPFVRQQGARGEIWAYGLRNPWRFSFDRHTGALWAADVGQNVWEEVDIVRKGGNYGWNLMEGAHCFRPATGCNQSGLELPVAEYNHDLGCSVTGGYVYRGKAVPALVGAYLYADFCSGRVWALRWDGARVTEHRQVTETGLSIASFAEDLEGELYVLAFDGNVYRMWAAR
jgi:glucose/arabinose dehydrogenase